MPALPVPDPFTLPDGTVVTGGKIEQGAYWQQKRAILLYSEFDDPAHLEHMALEPDSLAAWLGVSLQWTNPEGCRVESHPPDAEKNMGIPRPKLLMEIRKKIDEGEIKVEWPFDNEGGASGGDGATAGE